MPTHPHANNIHFRKVTENELCPIQNQLDYQLNIQGSQQEISHQTLHQTNRDTAVKNLGYIRNRIQIPMEGI